MILTLLNLTNFKRRLYQAIKYLQVPLYCLAIWILAIYQFYPQFLSSIHILVNLLNTFYKIINNEHKRGF